MHVPGRRRAVAGTVVILTAVALVSAVWFAFGGPRFEATEPLDPIPAPAGAAVLVGAGDIARCDSGADEATARLLDAVEGTVFTAGDNAYQSGTEQQFRDCYDPSWGRHRARTIPAAGNHDWLTADAAGYRAYFGRAAGAGVTWHEETVGSWQVLVLDSDCLHVGGCDPDSAQGRWLRDVLRDGDQACTLAIWHHPRFSSGQHGDDVLVTPLWTALQLGGADVVVNGHDHDYERFAPQDADGAANPDAIRQFVAGTGGAGLRDFEAPRPNSEVRDRSTHGVLRLVLWPDRYEWQFIGIDGTTRDQGTDRCHEPLP